MKILILIKNLLTILINFNRLTGEETTMLSKWPTLFLIIMTLPIMGHVVILPLMLDVAGRDILISILLSLPGAILFAYAIFRLRLYYPTTEPKALLAQLLGYWGGRLFRLLFIIYFLFLTIISFVSLVDFVYIGFFPDTPILALIIWFLIFFLYAVLKGYKHIALTSGVLALIGVVTGHSITLMDSEYKDWNEMFPLLEFGWAPALWGSLILTSIWMELLLLLFIPLQDAREKRLFLMWFIGIIIVALTMFSTANGSITIFGLGQAENFTYPAQEIVRLINLGFIDRFDIYGMILMTFGVYIRCSLFFRFAYDLSLPQDPTKWQKRVVFPLFVVITIVFTYYLAQDHFRVGKVIVVYTYMILLFPVPFILLIIAKLKRTNERNV